MAAVLPAVAAAQNAVHKKGPKQVQPRYERLACRLGTEDEQARMAVELADGRVTRFAYYSKWKPRTCSMEIGRGDAYSRWQDDGKMTIVTLDEDKGAFLIENGGSQVHFLFLDIDRTRYCGMEGTVRGSLTVARGTPQCALEGVMDRGE